MNYQSFDIQQYVAIYRNSLRGIGFHPLVWSMGMGIRGTGQL